MANLAANARAWSNSNRLTYPPVGLFVPPFVPLTTGLTTGRRDGMAGGGRAEMSGYPPAERAIRPAREQDAQPDFALWANEGASRPWSLFRSMEVSLLRGFTPTMR